MAIIRLAALAFCAVAALLSSPVTFQSGTLLWSPQQNYNVLDITAGGDLTNAAPVFPGLPGYWQSGQIAFRQDLTQAYATVVTNRRVVRVTATETGMVSKTIATMASSPYGIVVTPAGKIYVSCSDNKIYDVTNGANNVVVASGLGKPRNMLWTPEGILVVEQNANRVTRLGFLEGNPGPAQVVATGIVDGKDIEMYKGRIYVSSLAGRAIYDITSGTAEVFATGQSFIGLATSGGRLYASNFEDTTSIFDITTGTPVLFAWSPVRGETMFDGVPYLPGMEPGSDPEPTPTPEASTMILFGTGLTMLGYFRLRH